MLIRITPTLAALNLCWVNLVYAGDSHPPYIDPINKAEYTINKQLSSTELFNRAVARFKTKQYYEAIELFLAAKQNGMKLPQLHFNLGSAYYKTKQFDAALIEFKQAAKEKNYSVLSGINVALSLLKLSQPQAATLQLNRVLTLTTNRKYLHLVQRIAKKYQLSLHDDAETVYWQNTYGVFFGVIDNLILQDETMADSDNEFLQLAVSSSYLSSGLLNIRLALQSTNYFDTDLIDYDYIQVNIEPELRLQHQQWRYTLTAIYQPSTLAGNAYVNTNKLRSKLSYQLNSSIYLGTALTEYEYDSRSTASAYLAGHAIKREVFLNYNYKQLTMNLNGYRQNENRRDIKNASASLTRSFSPRRHAFSLQTEITLNNNSQIGLLLQYRRSQYPLNNRIDNRQNIRISYIYKLTKTRWMSLISTKIKNESENSSNVSLYSYQSNSYQFGLSGTF